MTDFHEVRFPTKISYGSTGGPQKRTDIITLANGFEERNSPWKFSRHKYNVGYGIKNLQMAYQVVEFFGAREAQLFGFRYKDWADFKSGATNEIPTAQDQVIGIGNGTTQIFQLVKQYADFGNTYVREITKPVESTIKVSIDNTLHTENVDYVIDITTGQLIFALPPLSDTVIRAGFEFDVPVRFDTDWLPINLSNYEAGEFADIPLIEVRTDMQTTITPEDVLWNWLQATDINTAVNLNWQQIWGAI